MMRVHKDQAPTRLFIFDHYSRGGTFLPVDFFFFLVFRYTYRLLTVLVPHKNEEKNILLLPIQGPAQYDAFVPKL